MKAKITMALFALAHARKIAKGDRSFRKHRAVAMPFGL
jgi:hypothetical protein